MPASQAEQVRAVAAAAVDAAGLVVEDVAVSQAGRRRVVRIVVDLPEDAVGGVGLDAVAEASRRLSEALDAAAVLGDSPYLLEVTSPGVSRPLTERRHWRRARTRLVRVRTSGAEPAGQDPTGRLTAVDDDGITLLVADGTSVVLPWERVRSGEVQVEFAPPGAADADADDADDDDEAQDADEGEDG